jgi:prostaglandin-endoperoxide synthase 2
VGSDRANTQIGYLMLNVLFLREHNRIARELASRYGVWDDERLFQTTRNILIVVLVRIVLDEYINHIAPYHFNFYADPDAFPNERWHRQNWMTTEFNLLYRWHSLIPSTLQVNGQEVSLAETLYTTEALTTHGRGTLFEDASLQRAGRVGLFNTPVELLRETDLPSIIQGRELQLASYNDYRECCQFPRVTAFNQISGDARVQSELSRLYANVDRLDFYVGLFAEDLRPNSALPALIGRLVGIDAFSQALTNPLLAPLIYNECTFSPYGMEVIESTNNLTTILHRNLPPGTREYAATMTRVGWQHV